MKTFSVCASARGAETAVARAIKSLVGNKTPVFVCIGTDAVTGDSLGPLTGTLLSEKLNGKAYVLGTLERPLTALDVNFASEFVKKVYPYGAVIAIDAALGKREEIGTVLISDFPVKPGLGVKKDLNEIGDVSVIGIVNEKTETGGDLGAVRLSLVYRLASLVTGGIEKLFDENEAERASGN